MNLEMEIVITGLMSALLGGAITFLALSKLSFLSTIKEDNERLRKEIEEVKERLTEVEEREKEALEREAFYKNKIVLLETAHHDLPFPQWLKDTSGVMLSLNYAYEKMFLEPIGKTSSDYIGRTDFDIWPEDVAKRFAENDTKAKDSKTYWMGIEPIWIKNSDISKYWRIAKYGRFVGDVCIGIAGIAIPVLDFETSRVPDRKFVEYLVSNGKLKEAIDALLNMTPDDDSRKAIMVILARLNKLIKQEAVNTIDSNEADLERNKICNALLKFAYD